MPFPGGDECALPEICRNMFAKLQKCDAQSRDLFGLLLRLMACTAPSRPSSDRVRDGNVTLEKL